MSLDADLMYKYLNEILLLFLFFLFIFVISKYLEKIRKLFFLSDAEQCLSYTGMLAEHFNPHVRYGAAMALGISCAGSGYKVCS